MDNDVKVSNKKIQINIRLDEETKNMLFELANKVSRSQNNYIAYLIKEEYKKLKEYKEKGEENNV